MKCRSLIIFACRLAAAAQIVQRTANSPWQLVRQSQASNPVSFSITLAGERQGELEQKMNDIASERSNWLSTEELAAYVAPSAKTREDIEQHLADHGVSTWSYNRLGNVIKILNTTLRDYRNIYTGETLTKTGIAHLPDHIAHNIESLGDLTSFPGASRRYRPVNDSIFKARRATARSLSGYTGSPEQAIACDWKNVSYPCISQSYGYKNYRPAANSESAAVLAIGNLWTDQSLRQFTANFRTDASRSYLPNKLNFRPTNPWKKKITKDDGEDVMDIEIMVGIAYPLTLSTIAVGTDGASTVQSLIDMPDSQRPGVVSISYGDVESVSDAAYSMEFCKRVQQLAALGTTYLAATGDYGVEDTSVAQCPPFQVDMMSACPYVVGVGATTNFHPERAAFDRTNPNETYNGWSSGGFSSFQKMPAFQKGSADKYLKSINYANSQYYNKTGRGVCDCAAFGEGINVAENGGINAYGGGTSASAPIVASILALVNAKCKAKGKPRIGWAHPTFYKNHGAFHDITIGGSYSCKSTDYGFPCREGWDPATGLGSPDFNKLVAAFGCA